MEACTQKRILGFVVHGKTDTNSIGKHFQLHPYASTQENCSGNKVTY